MFPDISCDDIFRLETERLWMRWLRASDAAAVKAMCSLADVAQMTASIPHPYPSGEAERFILRAREETAGGRALVLALTLKNKARTFVGVVSAQWVDRAEVEVGYIIAPPQVGVGYATEATATLVDAVFDLTQARALTANTRVINPASRKVLEKCGFKHVETAAKELPARGGHHSCDFFRRSRADWSRGRFRRLPGMMQQPPRREVG